ncbi:MAG TPA: hypothetical protein VJ927_10515 [Actinomycetota bacterium]|nr:hypothetical protein [Actinomycetota bacterium]
MDRGRKLELNLETVRELSEDELQGVAAGEAATQNACGVLTTTQSPACPSGATWFAPCETYNGTTCS